jgi:hypothetical protein
VIKKKARNDSMQNADDMRAIEKWENEGGKCISLDKA